MNEGRLFMCRGPEGRPQFLWSNYAAVNRPDLHYEDNPCRYLTGVRPIATVKNRSVGVKIFKYVLSIQIMQ